MVSKPKVLVLSGHGLNCETETAFAFEQAGAQAQIIHIQDLIDNKKLFAGFEILVFPGGFSFGDDMGSGKALANIIKKNLYDELLEFKNKGNMILGICNGFQVLTQLGLLPGALMHNDSARFIDTWVGLKFSGDSPWLKGLAEMSLPIAHGEGRYFLGDEERDSVISAINAGKISVLHYTENPNGSLEDIAGITDESGLVLGMMPHPERAIFSHHHPNWTQMREAARRQARTLEEFSPSLQLFKNAVQYLNSKQLSGASK